MHQIQYSIFISFLFIGCLLGSCVSISNTNQTKNEVTSIRIEESKEALLLTDLAPQNANVTQSRGLMTAEIIGKGVSLAVDGVKKLIEIDEKKYTAEYTSALDELYFYYNLSERGAMDPEGIQFSGINFLRMVDTKEGVRDTAVYLSLALDTSNPLDLINNGVFGLKVADFKLKYSKAKIPTTKWFLPWTLFFKNDKKINIDFDILIKARWTTSNGILYDNIEVGHFYFNLRDIPLEASEQKEFTKQFIGQRIDGYSFLVPRSYGFYYSLTQSLEQCYGQGMYNIQVNVNESGKEKLVTKLVQENYETLLDELKNNIK